MESCCREVSDATICSQISSLGLGSDLLIPLYPLYFFVFFKVITLASMGSATIVGKQNQLVQMGTSWRGQ